MFLELIPPHTPEALLEFFTHPLLRMCTAGTLVIGFLPSHRTVLDTCVAGGQWLLSVSSGLHNLCWTFTPCFSLPNALWSVCSVQSCLPPLLTASFGNLIYLLRVNGSPSLLLLTAQLPTGMLKSPFFPAKWWKRIVKRFMPSLPVCMILVFRNVSWLSKWKQIKSSFELCGCVLFLCSGQDASSVAEHLSL